MLVSRLKVTTKQGKNNASTTTPVYIRSMIYRYPGCPLHGVKRTLRREQALPSQHEISKERSTVQPFAHKLQHTSPPLRTYTSPPLHTFVVFRLGANSYNSLQPGRDENSSSSSIVVVNGDCPPQEEGRQLEK